MVVVVGGGRIINVPFQSVTIMSIAFFWQGVGEDQFLKNHVRPREPVES